MASQDDYGRSIQALLPPGKAWTRRAGANLTKLCTALGGTFARLDAAVTEALGEASPDQATLFIDDWERALGLPDPCIGQLPDIASRRALAFARDTDDGHTTPQSMVDLALTLGYAITIKEHRGAYFGIHPVTGLPNTTFGGAFGGYQWNYVWDVIAPATTVKHCAFGSPFGSPFSSWGNKELECEIRAVAPAHGFVRFIYQ